MCNVPLQQLADQRALADLHQRLVRGELEQHRRRGAR